MQTAIHRTMQTAIHRTMQTAIHRTMQTAIHRAIQPAIQWTECSQLHPIIGPYYCQPSDHAAQKSRKSTVLLRDGTRVWHADHALHDETTSYKRTIGLNSRRLHAMRYVTRMHQCAVSWNYATECRCRSRTAVNRLQLSIISILY